MKIVLTGGGTGGHVIPALALCDTLQKEGYEIHYIGSHDGIEKQLVTNAKLPYYPISSGKLRRYIDKKNITDTARVVKGISDAKKVLKKIKPQVVFSKGGFVSVPVVIAARLAGIPVVIHESDISMGLANKIATKFATKVCVTFKETAPAIGSKAVVTGTPIRKELFAGDITKGRELTGFANNLPVVMVMGGSSGAVAVNNAIREALPRLMPLFNIVHICGKGNVDNSVTYSNYRQYEFVSKELPHLFALCDVIVSRAGSNAIQEFVALKKPSLLIPLPLSASRGDQIHNANSFKKDGYSMVLAQEDVNPDSLVKSLRDLHANKDKFIKKMASVDANSAVKAIVDVIKTATK